MRQDPKCHLVSRANKNNNRYQKITVADAGWKHLNFEARNIRKSHSWEGNTGSFEMLFVLLGGNFIAATSKGTWQTINGRKDVFSGFPHALYLPPNTSFTITADSETLDIACGYVLSDEKHEPVFITPEDVDKKGIELRGGDNASRQINSILPPGSPFGRLVCVEVYTPSGNWSSFPAHKHDDRKTDENGKVKEASLEEIYFYKIDKPQGFALQKVYTDDRSLNELAELHNNDAMLIPRGYHPVAAGHGYNVYYLNFLAGSDQSLANTDDPDHKWIYGTWKSMDSRLPLVTLEMNNSQ
jgi:5-deoxy-glucuronate isomerase